MKTSAFSLLAASLGAAVLVAGQQCSSKGNNCARAVTGTFQSQQSAHRNDCSSFQLCTVFPATQTIVVSATSTPPATLTTVTVTTTTVPPAAVAKRDTSPQVEYGPNGLPLKLVLGGLDRRQAAGASTVCPSAVPSYASACTSGGSSFAYASACSCAGVTKVYTTQTTPILSTTSVVTTLPASISTVGVTATATSTPSPPDYFKIRVGTSTSYFQERQTGSLNLAYNDATLSTGTVYGVAIGLLLWQRNQDIGYFLGINSGDPQSPLYINADSGSPSNGGLPASIGNYDPIVGAYKLNINPGNGRTISQGANGLVIAAAANQNYPALPQLYAIPASVV